MVSHHYLRSAVSRLNFNRLLSVVPGDAVVASIRHSILAVVLIRPSCIAPCKHQGLTVVIVLRCCRLLPISKVEGSRSLGFLNTLEGARLRGVGLTSGGLTRSVARKREAVV